MFYMAFRHRRRATPERFSRGHSRRAFRRHPRDETEALEVASDDERLARRSPEGVCATRIKSRSNEHRVFSYRAHSRSQQKTCERHLIREHHHLPVARTHAPPCVRHPTRPRCRTSRAATQRLEAPLGHPPLERTTSIPDRTLGQGAELRLRRRTPRCTDDDPCLR